MLEPMQTLLESSSIGFLETSWQSRQAWRVVLASTSDNCKVDEEISDKDETRSLLEAAKRESESDTWVTQTNH